MPTFLRLSVSKLYFVRNFAGRIRLFTSKAQFLAYLGSGTCPKLIMLWGPAGCTSWMQFLELHEDDASLIRVGLYVTAAGIHEKHIAVREIGINRAVILADNRVPMEKRRGRANQLFEEMVRSGTTIV